MALPVVRALLRRGPLGDRPGGAGDRARGVGMEALKSGQAASGPEPGARATLSCLDGEPETLSVPWNPASYKLHRQAPFAAAAARGPRPQPRLAAGGAERLWTEL